MTENEKRNLFIITEVCESFNRHNIEAILSRFAENAIWLTSRGNDPEGHRFTRKKEIRKILYLIIK